MTEQYLKYTFCFERHTFSGQEVASWLRKGIGFKPKEIRASITDLRSRKIKASDIQNLSCERANLIEVYLQGEGRRRFTITAPAHPNYRQVVYLTIEKDEIIHPEVLQELTLHPNLIVGYCCDEEDEFLQSAAHSSRYKVRNKSLAGVAASGPEHFGEFEIDVSNNPGRRIMGNGYWIMSCWRMWFGKRFFEEVASLDRIMAFSGPVRKKWIGANRLFVELYEDAFSPSNSGNRILQKKFSEMILGKR